MSIAQTREIVGFALALIALLGAVLGWLRWVRPRWRRFRGKVIGALDALVGRDAIRDSITDEEISPALPGIGQRMASVEIAVSHIADLLVSQQAHDRRLESVEGRVTEAHQRIDQHDHDIAELQGGVIERVAGKAESVAAWRAVEAVAKNADPIAPALPEKEDPDD